MLLLMKRYRLFIDFILQIKDPLSLILIGLVEQMQDVILFLQIPKTLKQKKSSLFVGKIFLQIRIL